MSLRDRIEIANADRREDLERRRLDYWVNQAPRPLNIGGRHPREWVDIAWILIGVAALALGALSLL